MKTKITTHSDALNMISSLTGAESITTGNPVFSVDYPSPTQAVVTHSNGVVVLRATWNMSQPTKQPVTVKHHSKLFKDERTEECESCEKLFKPEEIEDTIAGMLCKKCSRENISITEDEDEGVCFDFS